MFNIIPNEVTLEEDGVLESEFFLNNEKLIKNLQIQMKYQ